MWVNYAYYILVLLSLLAAVYTRAFKKPLLFISMLCFLSITVQLFVELKGSSYNYFPIFTVYQLLEFIILSIFCYFIFTNKRVKAIGILLSLLYIIWFVGYIYKGGMQKESFESFFFRAPILIYFSLLWFYQIIKSPGDMPLTRNPLFWINAGHLIYFGLSLFAMGFYTTVYRTNPVLADNMLYFTRVANYILYSLYIVAFICFHKSQK